MGLNGLPIIAKQLIAHGLSADTPAALIEQGTTVSQKVYTAALSDLPTLIEEQTIAPPTLMIIGSVVSLHKTLNWFEPPAGNEDSAPSIGHR